MDQSVKEENTNFRGQLSRRLAMALVRKAQKNAARGSMWSLRPRSWQMLPAAGKTWLSYNVLARLEAAARETIEHHEVLGPIAAASKDNAWAITPAAMLYLWDLIERTQPRSIIEFGSGQSTRIFAAYAQKMSARGRAVSLLSVEHDAHWLGQTRAAIESAGQSDYVQFQLAPLSKQQLLGRTVEAYSVDATTLARAAGGSGFNVCFIDGPSGTVGRAGGLALVADYLANDATVLLDDSLRNGEQAVICEWQSVFARQCGSPRIQMVDRHGMLHINWKSSSAHSQSTVASPIPTRTKAAPTAHEPRDSSSLQFVAVAPNRWDGQWMNRQHLMWAVKEHTPVVYVQEPEAWYTSRKPRDEHFFRSNVEHKATGLSVVRLPKVLSSRGRQGAWNATANRLKTRIIDSVAPRSSDPRIYYFWHPELYRYIELLQPALTVYHMFDRAPEYFESKYANTPIYDAFHQACEMADIVVCGTREQADVIQNAQPVIVPNGVAVDWYEEAVTEPDDIAAIPRPRIGYAGMISNKLDFAWFEKVAEQQGWQLVLVGPLGNLDSAAAADFSRLCSRDNVHYLGSKPARSLPAYLKSFDVGLINYRRGMHSEAASPLKLYEYAAAGLPMVGSPMAAMAGDPQLAGLIELVDSPQDAVEAVAQALALGPDRENIERRKEFARHNSWQHRAQQILQLVKAKLNGSAQSAAAANWQASAAAPETRIVGNPAPRIAAVRSN